MIAFGEALHRFTKLRIFDEPDELPGRLCRGLPPTALRDCRRHPLVPDARGQHGSRSRILGQSAAAYRLRDLSQIEQNDQPGNNQHYQTSTLRRRDALAGVSRTVNDGAIEILPAQVGFQEESAAKLVSPAADVHLVDEVVVDHPLAPEFACSI